MYNSIIDSDICTMILFVFFLCSELHVEEKFHVLLFTMITVHEIIIFNIDSMFVYLALKKKSLPFGEGQITMRLASEEELNV